jgi:hypothetical protein
MMPFRSLLSVLLWTGAGAAVSADESVPALPKAPPTSGIQMIIWGGGDTRAEADALLKDYNDRVGTVGDFRDPAIQTRDPYPRVVESAKVPGLAPGFFIVALGTCPDEAVRPLLKLLAPLQRGVYARPIDTKKPPQCPSLGEGWDEPAIAKSKTKDGFELTAVVFTRSQDERDPSDSSCGILLELRSPSGQLLQHVLDAPRRCLFDSLHVRRDGIVVRYNYSSQSCTLDERSDVKELSFIEDAKIKTKLLSSRVTNKMACD